MNPPPGSVVVVGGGLAISEDPWEAVISGKVELNFGNPEVVVGASVGVRDSAKLVSRSTGNDVVVSKSATVVVSVKSDNGAAVVLGAATFGVVSSPGLAVIVIVVAVVVLVT